jgi:hypothetical protein
MSGMPEIAGNRRKEPEYKGFIEVLNRKKCPVSFRLSGFAVPRKPLKKANELTPCTPNPDKITADQTGCKVQGLFDRQRPRSNRRAVINSKASGHKQPAFTELEMGV